jgi:hypothetical protein
MMVARKEERGVCPSTGLEAGGTEVPLFVMREIPTDNANI